MIPNDTEAQKAIRNQPNKSHPINDEHTPGIGCGTIIIGIVIVILCCLAARSCSNDFRDAGERSQYEYSLLD